MKISSKQSFILLLMLFCTNTKALFLEYLNPKSSSHCLSHEFLASITQAIHIPIFIETGTFQGFTTEAARSHFSEIHTVELGKELYAHACQKFSAYNHIHAHCGDSGSVLKKLISDLNGQLLFWLDAHYSGNGTAFAGSGTPILEELDAIKLYHQNDTIIMIDDIRLFDLIPRGASAADGHGFPDMTDIFKKLIAINPDYIFALIGDTLMAFDHNKNISLSPVVQACTQSRLGKSMNLSDEKIKLAEETIFRAQGVEKNTFRALHDVYCHPQSTTPSPYYHVWFGLTLLADKQFALAEAQFARALALEYNAPRIQFYLTCAQKQQMPF